MAFLCVLFLLQLFCSEVTNASIPDARPPASKRTFVSSKIDALITYLQPLFAKSELGTLFGNCLPNTLDTTVLYSGKFADPLVDEFDSFVITGDISAMWLRDSTNQVVPFIPYTSEDSSLNTFIIGLINRQARSILIDPFANAFNFNASGQGHQSDKRTPPMSRSVFEGKYEIDSICAFMKLSYWYFVAASADGLTTFFSNNWLSAMETVITTIQKMQKYDGKGENPPYTFQRYTTEAMDTLMVGGRGPPASKLTGLTRSLFRPSDDAVTLPFNIPGNAMACVELNHLAEILDAISHDATAPASVISRAQALSTSSAVVRQELCSALEAVMAATNVSAGAPIPYEVDGGDGKYFMDDANIPSLLSLPVLGYMSATNSIYSATRAFVLSDNNPYFFSGVDGEGVGGPHVGFGYAWPMGIVMRAMTSQSDEEITRCLDILLKSADGTGFMHESFNVNNSSDFSRSWFAWANGLFGELILQLVKERPHLVLSSDLSADQVRQAQAMVQTPISVLAQKTVLQK